MIYQKRYRVDALLRLLKYAIESETVDHLHVAMEKEIAMSSQRIKRTIGSGDDSYIEAVTDDECDQIQEFLGISFVVAQTFVTRIRSHVADLSEGCKRDFGSQLSFIDNVKAYDVLKIADRIASDSSYSIIEAINAIANYWKHVDEWPTVMEEESDSIVRVWDTTKMRRSERLTVKIVCSLGMSANSTGNLRSAAEKLGIKSYEDLLPIRNKLKYWAENLYKKAYEEVTALKNKREDNNLRQ